MGASLSAPSQGQQSSETSLHPSVFGQNILPSGFVSPANSEQLSKEKKRKSTTLSTLRRRLIRKRRTSKSFDHAQVFRAFLSFWNKKDVVSLVEEYDSTSALKDLAIQADIARLESNTCRQDLGELFECKYFSDINLIYQGVTFPVHRALLAARCPFFRELLNDISLSCNEVMVDIDIAGMSVQMFNDLLKYLYTGELSVTEKSEGSLNILYQLSEQFGIPNPLEQDLKFLLEMGMYCDARLVFSSGVKRHHFPANALRPNSTDLYIGCYSGGDFEIPCHIAVLSARSPFFRNVIRRHFERQADLRVHDFVPARIVLDESIIPRRFAKIVVQALYQDVPDFSSLLHHLNRVSSVNDLPLSSSGMIQKDPTEETMQLYEIAKFLEMDSLAQSCEDTIVESLTLETVIPILKWSSQPHGSQWVRRQALAFIREEFMSVSSSITLLQLEKSDLVEIVQSDFVQASELEVLQAVLKWGEHQLMRRIEEREPNLVSQTAHSVSRRGLKRRDLCDLELREILADVICHIRINHILPQDSEILVGSIKRGLIPSPPPHMLSDEVGVGPRGKIAYWVRGSAKGGPFVRPRLFTPYIEEAKSWLEEEFGQEAEVTHRHVWQISHIPDTLYMVDKPFLDDEHWQAPSNLDIVKGMVLDDHTMKLLRNREDELRKMVVVQKAYSIVRNPYEVTRLLLLRVARDFGLPDITADILQQRPSSYASGVTEEVPEIHLAAEPKSGCRSGICAGGNSGLAGAIGGSVVITNYNKASGESRRPNSSSSSQIHRRFCSEHQLSGIIPDIAMATSLMGRMQLLDGEAAAESSTAGEKRESKSSRLAMPRSAMKQNRDSCR